MITYTRQPDGTFVKAGEFAAVPAEVRIQIGDTKPFSGSYTLAQATAIIEEAISKNQVQKDVYRILPVEEKAPKAAKAPKAPKEPKAPKQPKAPKPPKEKKERKPPKYDVQQFVTIYKNTGNLEDVMKATGASRAYVHRSLVKLGLYQKPAPKVKPEATLTEAEEARLVEILATFTETIVGDPRKLAIKQLRKEQRAANKPPKAPKAPRVFKYDIQQFAAIYKATGDLNAVVIQTGASKVYAQRALTKLGLYVKPVKQTTASVTPTPAPAETVVATEVPAPAVEQAQPTEAPAAVKPARVRKSKPHQQAPAVETTSTKK